jgi:hypothetical protein
MELNCFLSKAAFEGGQFKEKNMSNNKIDVVVKYVGKSDFTDNVPAEMVLQAVKAQALKYFELDPGSADKYVLQYGGADVSQNKHAGDFGVNPVTFTLMLAKEVNKG